MHAAELLSRRAELTPERIAVVELATGGRISYAELNARANRLANLLIGLGVEKGDRVSILAHNSVVYLDLLYGLGKIGAIFAPLNWRLTARELAYIIGDCEPKVLLVGPEFAGVAADLLALKPIVPASRLLSLEAAQISGAVHYDEQLESASPAEPVRPPLDEESPYCLLYTSGTTGRPKGAVLPHRQILWNCINTVISWGLNEADVTPVFTPLFHAGGLFAFLLPLHYAGGRVILARTFDAEASLQAIQQEGCTVVLGVPTLFQIWKDSPAFPAADFQRVRFFINGGAAIPLPLLQLWREAKCVIMRQGYGLTEAGVNCFSMTDAESARKAGSVGKPIFHSQMRLVDPETSKDVEPGETGELLIAGPHIFAGYWRNPQATAETIRDGWLYTGDMARRDEDGFYYITGRYKDMIKSGGENIYAAEVEAAFRDHPAVADCALIGLPDSRWGEVGLMVVVLKPEARTEAQELQDFCQERLARFKIPRRVEFVDSLPYSPYGKVLKTELKTRFQTA